MPATVILTAIYGTIGAATAALGAFGVAAATFAINFAVSAIVSRVFISRPDAPQDTGSRQQMPPSSDNPIPIAYGDAWLGGKFVDAVLSVDQKTMYYVMAISHVSPNGLFTFDTGNFYYGDRKVTFDGTDLTKVASLTDGAGNVDTKIADDLFIWLYRSTAAGVITPLNSAAAPSTVMGGADIAVAQRWTGTRQMNGLAFAIIKLNYNTTDGITSLSPLTFKVNHYLNGAGVARPGDVFRDYLNSSVYGGAVLLSNINTTACTALNTYSDALITYTPSGGGTSTQARYRINGVIDTGEQILSNVNKIMMACDSWMSYESATGQWAPVINKATATSFAFTDANIIGDIRVSVTDLASSINQIEASFPFKGNKDQPEYIRLKIPDGLLYSNEPVNKLNTSFDLVNDSVQAEYLANRLLEQAREDLIVSFSTAYTGIQVNAGDVVTVTNTAYGWTNKQFRALKVQESSLPDGNLGAHLELSEYNEQVYDDLSIVQFSASPNSNLVSGAYFSTLSAPIVGDIQTTISIPTFSVSCQLPSSGRVNSVVLFYTTIASPTELDWKVWGSQINANGNAYLPGTTIKFPDVSLPGDTYYFAFKVANDIATSGLSTISSSLVWQGIVTKAIGGQTAYNDGTGFFIGYDTSVPVGYKMSIGNSSGATLTWNGSVLNLTKGSIFTATSGQRISINDTLNNKIQVYGIAGTLTAEIGGGNGVVWALADSTLQSTIQGNATGYFAGVAGSHTSSAGSSTKFASGVIGSASGATSRHGVFGRAEEYESVYGEATNAGFGNHGVRGKNLNGVSAGVATAGLVGGANGYDFYADGAGTNYGPFTGAHDGLMLNGSVCEPGNIVVDVTCIVRKNWSNTLFEVAESSQANQPGAVGVVAVVNGPLSMFHPSALISDQVTENNDPIMLPLYDQIKDQYTLVAINAVGEGQVYVCGQNGNIANGDYICTSDIPGKGMKQSGTALTNVTVAKAREDVTFDFPEQIKQLACFYVCG